MSSEFDELEEFVIAEMRKVYSEKVLDHFWNPRNLGHIPDADGFGRITGPCGDTMEIFLRVAGDKVVDTAFYTDGCGATIACGSMATELVKGKSIAEALSITSDEILNSLGGLPEEHLHCSVLAANALRAAVRDYQACKREPWKKTYRRRQTLA
ncbi:hypothetical protein ES703_42445 [subsurface metagenome]